MQNLKYLFTAEYKDGSEFEQNAEDVSAVDPLKSAFFDLKASEVKRFTLTNQYDKSCTYAVDLTDGHFEVAGLPFAMHDGDLKDFKVVFFRRHAHHVNQQIKDGQFVGKGEEVGHDITYHFGWQAVDEKGNNVQRVMVLN